MLSAAMLGAAGCGATAAGFGASSPWLQALRSKVETETARVLRYDTRQSLHADMFSYDP